MTTRVFVWLLVLTPALACLLVLGFLAACGTETVTPTFVIHPTRSNAPPSDATVLTEDSIPPGLGGQRLASWLRARDRLRGARPVVEVGSEDKGPELFGEIQDAKVDRLGRLWVLDGQTSMVSIFSADGTYLDGIGGEGDGPLELRHTRGLELLGGSRLAVFTARRQAKVFDLGPAGWQLDALITLPVTIEDNCSYSDRLFMHGVVGRVDQSLFYGTSELGDTTPARYGTGYRSDVKQFGDVLSIGGIACVPIHNLVVFAFESFPMVRAYSVASGELIWSAYIDAHVQQRIETTATNMKTYHGLRHDYLATVLAMSSGHVVLQYRRYGESLSLEAVRTFLVDSETGRGALVGNDLPEVESFHASGYVSSFEDPYPRLEIRAFEEPSATEEL